MSTSEESTPKKGVARGRFTTRDGLWLEINITPRWLAAFRIRNQRGQPVIAELRVYPDKFEVPKKRSAGQWSDEYDASAKIPPGGLSARILRQVRTGVLTAHLRTLRRHLQKEWGYKFPSLSPTRIPTLRTRGRKGRSDRELANISALYEQAYLSGRSATDSVAKAMKISREKARDAICRARKKGLLSPAIKQGKGGGLLTELGKKILNRGGKRHATKR